MKLKQYLTEERTKELSAEEAIDWIRKNAKQALKNFERGEIIYRGLRNFRKPYGYAKPKSGRPRKSANTGNYYTLFIDNNKKWSKYPKRSQSLIMATSKDNSMSYGALYVVFPKDGAKIGVVSSRDMWGGFDKNLPSGVDLWTLNNVVEKLLQSAYEVKGKKNNTQMDKSWAEFKKHMEHFDSVFKMKEEEFKKKLKDLDPSGEKAEEFGIDIKDAKTSALEKILHTSYFTSDFYQTVSRELFKDYKGSFEMMLQSVLDPDKNGFKLIQPSDKMPFDREIWTDAESVFVKLSIIQGKEKSSDFDKWMAFLVTK